MAVSPMLAQTMTQTNKPVTYPILERAREHVLEQGKGFSEAELVQILLLPDEALPDALALAHEVRLTHCGEEVEVEGIISIKTGGCPEDCHFCSQSGVFDSPVRSVWLDIPELVKAAKETAATGATEFCIVAAVRGPDIKLMNQIKFAIDRITREVDINIACSLGMLSQRQVDQLAAWGVHRYNHNLEAARSFFPEVVTTHTYEERLETCLMVKAAGMELCSGALIGMGESREQRAELAAQLAALEPHEVPLNFLNPRPGTPLEKTAIMDGKDALRAIVAFRLAMPHTVLRYAGGREITLGDLGTREGLLGGINAVIVGNYLTTLGRPVTADIDLLVELNMPIKELQKTL
jgi:biotin synthase